MTNTGAWPVDATTPVGMFRFQVGDVVGVPADPATDPQTAVFEFMSDATIEALLAAYPDSPASAKAVALQSMATQLIAAAQDIQVDDIKIKTVERANLMLKMSTDYMTIAGGNEADTAFSVIALEMAGPYCAPQGQPTPWEGMM